MQFEVALHVRDELGQSRRAPVDSSRFMVGRSDDNDLCIEDPSLSRRHAVIETFAGAVQISDCGSQNGTFVNGNRVTGAYVLNDGDEISFGAACSITVEIGHAVATPHDTFAERHDSNNSADRKFRPADSTLPGDGLQTLPVRPTIPLIAGVFALLIVLVSALLIALLGNSRQRSSIASPGPDAQQERDDAQKQKPPPADDTPRGKDVVQGVSIEEIERDVVQVMRRISSDPTPGTPPKQEIESIKERINQYRTLSTLPETLRILGARSKDLGDLAKNAGLRPDLVIYLSLASIDAGRTGQDPVSAVRAIVEDLPRLNAQFGTSLADRALLLVAAYKLGTGTRTSNPLLDRLRRVAKNPYTDSNVWYLHSHDQLEPKAYEFVLSFLALGVIAHDPRRFGVQADPLTF